MTLKTADIAAYNKKAWDALARGGNEWTIPVSPEVIAKARRGEFAIVLTPSTPVPGEWLGDVRGKRILGLACGGGQQAPILAAAGAIVTVIDNSPAQLAQDQLVAKREGLSITSVEGDMRDLSCFAAESFDLIFHPSSNSFVPDVRPVWREAFRVLKRGGYLLSGFVNPVIFIVDPVKEREGVVQFKYKVPYSDLDYLDDPEIKAMLDGGDPLSFGHTLEDQLNGQMAVGFHLIGLYEDARTRNPSPIDHFMKGHIATRALKP